MLQLRCTEDVNQQNDSQTDLLYYYKYSFDWFGRFSNALWCSAICGCQPQVTAALMKANSPILCKHFQAKEKFIYQ
uniref:Uncharacterized protein n=1 Tax=Globodera rostochiensis TaxID=31243 RepID=A0A914I062_GLORO